MPVELRGEGAVHRAIETEWRKFFTPTGHTSEVLVTRVRNAAAGVSDRLKPPPLTPP
jgi:hypothetical protein